MSYRFESHNGISDLSFTYTSTTSFVMHSCVVCVTASVYWYKNMIIMHFHLFAQQMLLLLYNFYKALHKTGADGHGLLRFSLTEMTKEREI